MHHQQVVDDSDSEDDEDEDEDDDDDEGDEGGVGGFGGEGGHGHMLDAQFAYHHLGHINQEQSFFSWDLLVKYVPKLPEVDLFLKRDQVRHKEFFTE